MLTHITWRIGILLLGLLINYLVIVIGSAIYTYKRKINLKGFLLSKALFSLSLNFLWVTAWIIFLFYEMIKFHRMNEIALRNINAIPLSLFIFLILKRIK